MLLDFKEIENEVQEKIREQCGSEKDRNRSKQVTIIKTKQNPWRIYVYHKEQEEM